jgi:hypothetical protein
MSIFWVFFVSHHNNATLKLQIDANSAAEAEKIAVKKADGLKFGFKLLETQVVR